MSRTTLENDIKIISGCAFFSSLFDPEHGMPLIRIRDIQGENTVVKYMGSYSEEYVVNTGDLLIGMDGDFNVVRWQGTKALLNQRVCKIQSTSEQIHQGFLFWYLQPKIKKIHATTPQTTVKHLSVKSVYAIEKPDLSYDEQETVADILDTLDTQIRETETIITKLQQVKQGLLHDLLTRGVDENGELRPSYEDAPELYTNTLQGQIPKTWELRTLASYTASLITYGIVQAGPHIEGGIPYIRTGDMSGSKLVKSGMLCTTKRIANSYSRSQVDAGDIVMSIRASVGKVLPVPDDLDGANLTQGTARIAPNNSTDASFLLWAIRHQRTQNAIVNEIKGTTFAEITLTALREVFVAAPKEKSEQVLIGNRLDAAADKIGQEQLMLQKLNLKKSGLMDDLLTGKKRVTDLLKQQAN